MTSETITLATADGPMPTYVAEPAGPPRGGVVVVQEAFGVTDHIQNVARRFAAAGWRAAAPALFHRSAAPAPVLAYDDLEHAVPLMGGLNRDGLMVDIDAATAFLAEGGTPLHRTAVVGFCMGGTVTTIAAASRPFGAAVAYYGGGLRAGRFGCPPLIEVAPHLQTPWLGLYGDLDKGIPVEDVEAMETAARTAPVPTGVVRYPDAHHGFNCDDRPAVYSAEATRAAWSHTLTWLGKQIPAE